MISPLWWLPLTLGAVGLIPLYRGARRLDSELAELRSAITRLSSARPALQEITAATEAAERAVEDLARQYTRST